MKKIAFVTRSLYVDSDFSSGGVKMNYFLLRGLYNKGYSIDLYSNIAGLTNPEILNAINCFDAFEQNKQDYDYVLSDMACIPSDITYIHSHSYLFRTQLMSSKFSHFFYKIFARKRHKQRMNEFLETKKNICETKKVIVSSEVLKQDMIDNYGVKEENICMIAPPVEKCSAISHKSNKVFTFGISAVGFERKGGYLMLKAIRDLARKHKNFKVRFIYPSDNFFVKFLVKFYNIGKYCEFLPIQKDMDKFYSSLDCLVMPSLLEPFGMVATEALNVGTPVITAKHCGASDYIQSGVNGFVYEAKKNSHKELVEAMEKMLATNDLERKCMQKEAIKSVEDLNLENFIEAYYKLINNL